MKFEKKIKRMNQTIKQLITDELISLISFNILNELSSDLTKPLRATILDYSRDTFEHNEWLDNMLNKDHIFVRTIQDYYSVLSCRTLIEMHGSENMQKRILPVIDSTLNLIRNTGV